MRLAALLGLQHDKWVCLACGNPAAGRPRYKTAGNIDLVGGTEVHYLDADGERKRGKTHESPEAVQRVKKVSRSRSIV